MLQEKNSFEVYVNQAKTILLKEIFDALSPLIESSEETHPNFEDDPNSITLKHHILSLVEKRTELRERCDEMEKENCSLKKQISQFQSDIAINAESLSSYMITNPLIDHRHEIDLTPVKTYSSDDVDAHVLISNFIKSLEEYQHAVEHIYSDKKILIYILKS